MIVRVGRGSRFPLCEVVPSFFRLLKRLPPLLYQLFIPSAQFCCLWSLTFLCSHMEQTTLLIPPEPVTSHTETYSNMWTQKGKNIETKYKKNKVQWNKVIYNKQNMISKWYNLGLIREQLGVMECSGLRRPTCSDPAPWFWLAESSNSGFVAAESFVLCERQSNSNWVTNPPVIRSDLSWGTLTLADWATSNLSCLKHEKM